MKDLSYRFAPVISALPAASSSLAGVTVRLATDNRPYWCDGAQWYDLTMARNPKITVSATQPSNPATNDLWIQI